VIIAKVDAGASDGQYAEQPAEQAGCCGTGDDAHFRRDAHVAHHQPADVAGRAEEGRVTEGQQAGKAEKQVEGAGEKGEQNNFIRKVG
jgi:hypothetical protein